MATRRRCVACGKLFGVSPQVPDQSYCAESACQRERKRLWQKERRAVDPLLGAAVDRAGPKCGLKHAVIA